MQLGPVPTDAKHILEGLPTNMAVSNSDLKQYISINEKTHRFKSLKAPEMGVFSVSDIKVINDDPKLLEMAKDMYNEYNSLV